MVRMCIVLVKKEEHSHCFLCVFQILRLLVYIL
jgi:hypothetical protein